MEDHPVLRRAKRSFYILRAGVELLADALNWTTNLLNAQNSRQVLEDVTNAAWDKESSNLSLTVKSNTILNFFNLNLLVSLV